MEGEVSISENERKEEERSRDEVEQIPVRAALVLGVRKTDGDQ